MLCKKNEIYFKYLINTKLMSTLNINGDNNDPFYRYKMPLLISRQAGRGNGCFTLIENLADVSKAINHPPNIVLKYMGSSLGANATESKSSITGHYSNEELIVILYQYINSFIMCPNCNIPELTPSYEGKKKNKKLILTCGACGNSVIKTHVSKDEEKGIDLILKYLENNEWTITKGTIVEKQDMFDPFKSNLF